MTAKNNPGFLKRIDTLELSDAFRRHAGFDRPKTVAKLVTEARNFAALSTWFDPYEKFRHKELQEKLGKSVERMAQLAVRLGVDEITLPVSGDPRSGFARFFEQKVLPGLDLPVAVTLQKAAYSKDLAQLGPIDLGVKTALDIGIRGVADIDDRIKNKWDRHKGL